LSFEKFVKEEIASEVCGAKRYLLLAAKQAYQLT